MTKTVFWNIGGKINVMLQDDGTVGLSVISHDVLLDPEDGPALKELADLLQKLTVEEERKRLFGG